MKEAGLQNSEVDITNFEEKFFYTFRKSHVFSEDAFTRYNPLYLVNTHHLRYANDRMAEFERIDLFK